VATLGHDGDYAFEAAVVGIVDDFDIPDAPESWRVADASVAGAHLARANEGAEVP
jgi:hypothetical protein